MDHADSERVIQGQLDAYNARDIDAFMTFWHEDAQIFEHPSHLLADGAAAIRERHRVRFGEPNLFGKLVRRMVMGSKVLDQEIVTRTFPEGPGRIEVIAIYEVTAGKIAKAWFLFGAKTLSA